MLSLYVDSFTNYLNDFFFLLLFCLLLIILQNRFVNNNRTCLLAFQPFTTSSFLLVKRILDRQRHFLRQ